MGKKEFYPKSTFSMKTVIFTTKNHIYANYLIKELLLNNLEVVAIIESDVIYPGKGKLEGIMKYLKISGLSYVFHQAMKVLLFQLTSKFYSALPFKNKAHPFFSYRILARNLKIPIYKVKDVNQAETIELLAQKKPDLFISLLFTQIFRSTILSLPNKGTINFHPALLPSYKGVSPTFWVLSSGESKTGVSIHKISDAKIDEGAILAQKEIPILEFDTEHTLYWRCVKEGAPLLRKVIKQIKTNKKVQTKDKPTVTPCYFSLPTKKAVFQFKNRGRKFFTLKGFFK